MKYIKTFESEKYKIGDYVYVETSDMRYPGTNIAKIYNQYDSSLYKFVVKINDKEPLHIREREVIRKLTTEEINDFITKKDAEKYNL